MSVTRLSRVTRTHAVSAIWSAPGLALAPPASFAAAAGQLTPRSNPPPATAVAFKKTRRLDKLALGMRRDGFVVTVFPGGSVPELKVSGFIVCKEKRIGCRIVSSPSSPGHASKLCYCGDTRRTSNVLACRFLVRLIAHERETTKGSPGASGFRRAGRRPGDTWIALTPFLPFGRRRTLGNGLPCR